MTIPQPRNISRFLRNLTFYSSILAIGYVLSLTLNNDARQESVRNENLPNIDLLPNGPSLTELYSRDAGELHEKFKSKIESLEEKMLGMKKPHPKVKFLPENQRKRILVTGGAGFVGSHLVDSLMIAGHEV